MELNKNRKWLYSATIVWLVTVLTMGVWWLYVAYTLATTLDDQQIESVFSSNLYTMLKWEGSFFLLLLFIASALVVFLFFKDQKKNDGLQKFFAGLTHELKTPLANVRLQTQFLLDLLNENNNPQVNKSLNFLNAGSYELEDRFDNMLQLSKIELSGDLNIECINLKRFIQNIFSKHPDKELNCKIEDETQSSDVLIDQYALKIIIRNLMENTLKHSKKKNVLIHLKEFKLKGKDYITLKYSDGGIFTGETKKLGQLFYKHNSHQGTGIGLYLVKKFTERMNGIFKMKNKNELIIELSYQASNA